MKKSLTCLIVIILTSTLFVCCNNNSSNNSYDQSSSSYNVKKTELTHRCGETWNGKRDETYGVYGDYCSERCYLFLYPN